MVPTSENGMRCDFWNCERALHSIHEEIRIYIILSKNLQGHIMDFSLNWI